MPVCVRAAVSRKVALEDLDRLPRLAAALQAQREIYVASPALPVFRLDLRRALVGRPRFRVPVLVLERDAQVVPRVGVPAVNRNRPPELRFGGLRVGQRHPANADLDHAVGVIRVQAQCALEAVDGFGHASLRPQRPGKAEMRAPRSRLVASRLCACPFRPCRQRRHRGTPIPGAIRIRDLERRWRRRAGKHPRPRETGPTHAACGLWRTGVLDRPGRQAWPCREGRATRRIVRHRQAVQLLPKHRLRSPSRGRSAPRFPRPPQGQASSWWSLATVFSPPERACATKSCLQLSIRQRNANEKPLDSRGFSYH